MLSFGFAVIAIKLGIFFAKDGLKRSICRGCRQKCMYVIISKCAAFRFSNVRNFPQDHGKGGLSLRGVAFMTVLAVLTVVAVLESTLPSFCFSFEIQHNEATVAV